MVPSGIKKELAEKKRIPPGDPSYDFKREGSGRAR